MEISFPVALSISVANKFDLFFLFLCLNTYTQVCMCYSCGTECRERQQKESLPLNATPACDC